MSSNSSDLEARYAWRLPAPYEDELAYCLLARIQSSWSYLDARGVLRQLLGFQALSLHPFAAPAVARVASMTLRGTDKSAQAFIAGHTLLPYFSAFSSDRELAGLNQGLQLGRRHVVSAFLCRPSLRLSHPRRLAACRDCMDEDVAKQREPYWRRSHQLPGVSRCWRHGTTLWASTVECAYEHGLHLLLPRDALGRARRRRVTSRFDPELEQQVLNASVRLLQGLEARPTRLLRHYRDVVLDLGYRARVREVAEQAFGKAFEGWLARRCVAPDALGPRRWWRCLLSGVQGNPNPLHHLLMRCFVAEGLARRMSRHVDPLDEVIDTSAVQPPARRRRRRTEAENE